MKGPPPVVLVAPSGAGKTTIAHRLVSEGDEFVFSVSATTRAPRPGEVDGADYDFVSREEFLRLAEGGALAEWATVHGEYYGTPLRNLDSARRRGQRVVLDIDYQGALQIREKVPDSVLVFILPPSGRVLLDRLAGRGTENRAQMERRLRTARDELEAARNFEAFVVNDDMDAAVAEVRAVARGEASGELALKDLNARLDQIRTEIEEELSGSSDRSGNH